MNYHDFVCNVTGFLRETLPCGTEFSLISVDKNNGVSMEGLAVRKKGERVAPTIYLEAYYREYLEGRSLPQIYERILECCEARENFPDFDADVFSDYEKIHTRVVYKLVSYEKNRELLQQLPHLPYLDLAIVFYCLLTDGAEGNTTILIRNSHLKLWGVNCSRLYKDARENTRRLLPARLQRMEDLLEELSGGKEEEEDDVVPMYVLTNTRRVLGAACILYDGMLKNCALRMGGPFYLLPSSVHEVILLPEAVVADREELRRMVREINATQVRRTEILSEEIYFYSPDSGYLSLIEEK